MKLYILIHEQDTDSAWGSSAKPFIDRAAAQDAMRQLERTEHFSFQVGREVIRPDVAHLMGAIGAALAAPRD